MENFNQYKKVQGIAKEVLDQIKHFIIEGISEKEIADKCIELLSKKGISKSWYYDVPALVLCGSRSKTSVSGNEYVPSCETVSNTDLMTIDLSPSKGNIWGDCARSYAIENGIVVDLPKEEEFVSGFAAEKTLHEELLNVAKPDMKFCQLYQFANNLIRELGFENLVLIYV